MNNSKLALFGGSKTISDEMYNEIKDSIKWPKISEVTVQKCCEIIRNGYVSVPSGWIIEEFENEFKNYMGTKHCLLQNNGTSTLHAAFYAVGVKQGDEVIVPSHTWVATVTPLHALGAIPVFCDIDEKTLTADPDDIERRITNKTKAICIVHLWGNVCDMSRIMEISEKYNLPVIEDCSHAHGASYNGKKVGSIGAVGCFSMQASKVVPAGELGAVVTNNDLYFDHIVALGHQGRIYNTAISEEFKVMEGGLGFKYRPFPVAAQIGYDMFQNIDEIGRQRRKIVDSYNKELEEIKGFTTIKQLPGTERVCYEYICIFDNDLYGVSMDRFIEALNAEGVIVKTMRYRSVHTVPPFTKYNTDLPVTTKLVPKMLSFAVFNISDDSKIESFVTMFTAGIKKVLDNIEDLK